ncbi:MAG: hypothetical protein HC806_10065 [Anaerolineae bacterium]|nr:hypothetical protein [Anaerolineae bacterium]
MNLISIIAFIVGFIYLLLALLLWRKDKDQTPITRPLGVFMFFFFLWGVAQGVWLGDLLPNLIEIDYPSLWVFSVGMIGFAYLDMSRRFLQKTGFNLFVWLIVIAFVASQIIIHIVQPPINNPLPFSLSAILIFFSAVFWVILTTITIELTLRTYRLKDNPLHRNRVSYWAITLILVTLGEAAFAINQPGVGNILLGIGAINAFYVVTTHRHPDIRLGILHVLGYVMTTVLIVVIYTLVYMTTNFIFQERMGTSPLTAGVVMALVLTIIFRPLFWQIQRNIESALGQDDTDNNQIIREYSLSISNILNLEQLAIVSTGLISEALDTRRGMLILVNQIETDQSELTFKLYPVEGGMGITKSPSPLEISPSSTITVFLSTQHRPLIQYDLDFMPLFNSVPDVEKEWFSNLEMDVYLPIYSKGIWIGLLAVGPKETGVPYSDLELSLMSTMSDQTSVALENARLVEGIIQVNLQLEQANASLGRAKDELERLDKAKSDFISIASHELRTPLTVIQGYTQMLNEDPGIEENSYHKNLLEGIVSGADRLHSIVESMLDVAKIDGRELQLAPVPIPIHSIIQNVCRSMTKAIEQRNLSLNVMDMSTLRPIEVDRDAIQKVFYHLINNAVKYTPDGGTISVSGRMLQRENAHIFSEALEIVVKDTGIGIDLEHQALIFRKFFRTGELGLHSSGKTKFKGDGARIGSGNRPRGYRGTWG